MTDTTKPKVQGCSGRFTLFEPVSPTNPPAGSENWPVVEMQVVSRFTMCEALGPGAPPLDPAVGDLTKQLAEQIAAVPEGERARLLRQVEQEIERAVSALAVRG